MAIPVMIPTIPASRSNLRVRPCALMMSSFPMRESPLGPSPKYLQDCGQMRRIPGDERERGGLGNRLRLKPLRPEVARHHQFGNIREKGSRPVTHPTKLVLSARLLGLTHPRLYNVSTVLAGSGLIEQANRALERGGTQVHVALRRAEILVPGELSVRHLSDSVLGDCADADAREAPRPAGSSSGHTATSNTASVVFFCFVQLGTSRRTDEAIPRLIEA
jgi:hypothetical protein